MSTLKRSTKSLVQAIPPELWKKLEDPSTTNIKQLIDYLEIAVSNGWMGVAAELSEFLEIVAADQLDLEPECRVKVEIERLKRFAYMEFHQATKSAADRVLGFLETHKAALENDERLVWESVAVTSAAWFATDVAELDEVINRCCQIDKQFEHSNGRRDLCASFMIALEGRRAALTGDIVNLKKKFIAATKLCRKHNLQTPLAHLIMHFAESLRLAGDWSGAVKLARDFLTKSRAEEKKPAFRSHLLLRSIWLLLEAPEHLVARKESEFVAYLYRLLVYAMGMEEAENVYPLLNKIKSSIAGKCEVDKPDLYSMFLPGPILDRINTFDGPSHERLLSLYYAANGYAVTKMGGSCPGVDLLIWKQDSPDVVIAIQAKSTQRKTIGGRVEMGKRDIPDEDQLDDAKRHLERVYRITNVSHFWWHCAAELNYRAEQLLNKRVRECFGQDCQLEQKLNKDVVEDLVAPKHITLLQRLWTNEFKIDERRKASKEKQPLGLE